MNLTLEPISVVGLGTMGTGIAFLLAQLDRDVRVCDSSPEITERAISGLVKRVQERIDRGFLAANAHQSLERIEAVYSIETAVAGAGLVLEAVFEDLDTKKQVLGEISRYAPITSVIASNTSAFPIDTLADFVSFPERFLGVHFFNPAEWIPGIEVIPGSQTAEHLVTGVSDLLERAGRKPVRVASAPGFVANRLQFALFVEAMKCVEDGIATLDDVDAVVRSTFGFRLAAFGPFAIADMAGLDVCASILQTLEDGLGSRFTAPKLLTSLVRDGRLGVKSGAGFSEYSEKEAGELMQYRDEVFSYLNQLFRDANSGYKATPRRPV